MRVWQRESDCFASLPKTADSLVDEVLHMPPCMHTGSHADFDCVASLFRLARGSMYVRAESPPQKISFAVDYVLLYAALVRIHKNAARSYLC